MKKIVAAVCVAAALPLATACSNPPDLPDRPEPSERPARADARPAQDASAEALAESLLDRFAEDRWSMPPAGSRLAHDGVVFAWDLKEAPARAFDDTREHALRAERAGEERLADRLRRVEVRVWLAEPSGGSDTFDSRLPHATVVRVIDPLAFPDADALDAAISEPGGLERLTDLLKTTEGGDRP